MRNYCTVCLRGCTILRSYGQCTGFQSQPPPHSGFSVLCVWLLVRAPPGCEVGVGLVCVSIRSCDVHHVSVCFWPICVSSLETCLLRKKVLSHVSPTLSSGVDESRHKSTGLLFRSARRLPEDPRLLRCLVPGCCVESLRTGLLPSCAPGVLGGCPSSGYRRCPHSGRQ